MEVEVDPRRINEYNAVSQRQMVERLRKAVSFNSKVIVFDEPTSSLTEESEHLFKIINMLRDRGVGIIYISHKMAEILRISDEDTLLCATVHG